MLLPVKSDEIMAAKRATSHFWTEEETEVMLQQMRELNILKFIDGRRTRNGGLYQKIAAKMEQAGFIRTPEQIKIKWKNARAAYTNAKKNNDKSGQYRASCPHYKLMEELLGRRPLSQATQSGVDVGAVGEADQLVVIKQQLDYDSSESSSSTPIPGTSAQQPCWKQANPESMAQICQEVGESRGLLLQELRESGECLRVPHATKSSAEQITKPLFTFPVSSVGPSNLESPWRDVEWTEERKKSLMKTIGCYRPGNREVSQTRVLLLGPISSGKSSFISSVQSVFNGRVTNRAMVGSLSTGFTKKLQSFKIHGLEGEAPDGLVLCDIMGLGDGEMTGLTLHDILSVIKGHVPEGHKFSPDRPVTLSETVGYVKNPSLKDKIHCVAFVVNASKIQTYPKSISSTFQQLREHIRDLGVHQVALLTHIDQLCSSTAKNVNHVYKSGIIQEAMNQAAALLSMPTSSIVPVKNYSSELDLDVNTDVLLLSALDHILQYAKLYFLDNVQQYTMET